MLANGHFGGMPVGEPETPRARGAGREPARQGRAERHTGQLGKAAVTQREHGEMVAFLVGHKKGVGVSKPEYLSQPELRAAQRVRRVMAALGYKGERRTVQPVDDDAANMRRLHDGDLEPAVAIEIPKPDRIESTVCHADGPACRLADETAVRLTPHRNHGAGGVAALGDDHLVAAIGIEVDETGNEVLEDAVIRQRGSERTVAVHLHAQLASFQVIAEYRVPVAPGWRGQPCPGKVARALGDPAMRKLNGHHGRGDNGWIENGQLAHLEFHRGGGKLPDYGRAKEGDGSNLRLREPRKRGGQHKCGP